MNIEFFPQFIRYNYPALNDLPNSDLFDIGNDFKEWLEVRYKDKRDTLKMIWDIDPKTVIMNQVNKHPFKVNGYEPSLLLNFEKYIQECIEEAEHNL